ncbi:MAG: hypothetical protein ABFS21_06390 [Actinomycetota bacterium]
MQYNRSLREAWQATVARLGGTDAGATVLLGPHAEILVDQLPGPTSGSTTGVATLGGEPIPEGAEPEATGLPNGSFDTAVALSAWESPADIGTIVDEAIRVTKSEGTVWLGEIDARTLTVAMPAARPYGLLYRYERSAAADVRTRFRAANGLGVEAVRSGLRSVTETRAELPAAVARSPEEVVEAVRSGVWPGTSNLDPAARDRLLGRVAESFHRSTRFPLVLTLPWTLVRGRRP